MKKFLDVKNLKWNKESALIIVLAGILCIVVVWPTSGNSLKTGGSGQSFGGGTDSLDSGQISSDSVETALNLYVENQEERLKSILEQMDGVGKIQVMIRAKASKEYVVEKDLTTNTNTVHETDAQGGTRQSNEMSKSESALYTKDGSGNDVPWVIKELEPEIEGVVVAAEGGGNENIASEITQAVQVLFDIPIHKIKVVKMKGE